MKDFLDKKFVTTAIFIAVVYVIITVSVNLLIGKEAAGVAGVALTALATAIFKQFERLRFAELSEDNIIIGYTFKWSQVVVLALFFAGLNLYLRDIKDYLMPYLAETMDYESYSSNRPDWHDVGIFGVGDYQIAINNYSIWEMIVEGIAFFFGGLMTGMAWRNIAYSTIIVASLIGLILDFFRENMLDYLFGLAPISDLTDAFDGYEYSFLYIILAFIGVYLTSNKHRGKSLSKS